jgi:hypothetical protein
LLISNFNLIIYTDKKIIQLSGFSLYFFLAKKKLFLLHLFLYSGFFSSFWLLRFGFLLPFFQRQLILHFRKERNSMKVFQTSHKNWLLLKVSQLPFVGVVATEVAVVVVVSAVAAASAGAAGGRAEAVAAGV